MQIAFATLDSGVLLNHTGAMDGMKRFGQLLKSAREEAGLDQEAVGTAVGRDGSFVSRFETGRNANPPDTTMFDSFARVLGLSKVEMLEAMGYLDKDERRSSTDGDDAIPASILRELRTIDWSSSWRVEYMLDAIRGLHRMDEQIKRVIAEEGSGYE